ncbi:MAG: DUF1080 domain-containing protein [Melioribacteraceae bacterium]|nr:DUF1080 domain-containing protein [Melioribacteraceae bacterium]
MNSKIILIGLMWLSFLIPVKQHAQNWQNLFNGEDLSNWQKLNGNAEFIIDGESIVGIYKFDTPNTFLATKNMFNNFILEYEVKIDDGLNSGVMIRGLSSPEYQDGRVYSYQVELDASARAWSGGIYDEARRGWLYNLEYNPSSKSAFITNGWNKFRVEAIGNHIQVWLNETKTSDLIDDMTQEGFIALQVHAINNEEMLGKKVQFKNIRILTENLDKYSKKDSEEIPQVSYLTNTLTEREIRDGWELLWDGKTTIGWKGAKLDEFPSGGWSINDGILRVEKGSGGESVNGGDIVTKKKYGNFILEVDFKYTEGANSGIKYFVDTDLNKGAGSSIGCEYQILDDQKHPDAKMGVNGNRTIASLYDLIKAEAYIFVPNENTPKRVNQYNWNRAKIVSKDGFVEHYLNGIKVVEYNRTTQMWKALVAYSKYKDWPNFGELTVGNILLQDHGDEVHFKNIKIKTLD